MINVEKLKKKIKSLNIPKPFNKMVDSYVDHLFTHDYTMILSIRQDAGKTTNCLLIALCCYEQNGTSAMYVRSDNEQIKRKSLEKLYGVINTYKDKTGKNYIEKIFNGEWNHIKYKPSIKKFYLEKLDEDGKVIAEDKNPILEVFSLEESESIKSTYNNPKCDIILFDEFMDTNRSPLYQMVELQDVISTVFRRRTEENPKTGKPEQLGHLFLLGNNTNQYNFWFSEFRIEEEITKLDYGCWIDKTTNLGTTLCLTLVDLTDEARERIEQKNIHYSGFDTPLMNSFNGLDTWRGDTHPHLPPDWIKREDLIIDNLYIKHRNIYVRINVYCSDERGQFVFCHRVNTRPEEGTILTITPEYYNELYGWGAMCLDPDTREVLKQIYNLRRGNKWFYANNRIGDLIDDFNKCQK